MKGYDIKKIKEIKQHISQGNTQKYLITSMARAQNSQNSCSCKTVEWLYRFKTTEYQSLMYLKVGKRNQRKLRRKGGQRSQDG